MILRQTYILVADLLQTGLTGLTVSIKAPSSTSFVPITSPVIAEADEGFYNITIPGTLITEYGTYVIKIVDGLSLSIIQARECNPTPLYSTVPPEVCVVYGSVRNASAKVDAFEQIRVEAMPLKLPSIFSGTFTMGKRVICYTDYAGDFQLPLIRGMTALIEIKDVGVRFQAVIPDAMTVSLEDLIP
jgi:hypothetical protein